MRGIKIVGKNAERLENGNYGRIGPEQVLGSKTIGLLVIKFLVVLGSII